MNRWAMLSGIRARRTARRTAGLANPCAQEGLKLPLTDLIRKSGNAAVTLGIPVTRLDGQPAARDSRRRRIRPVAER